MFPYVQEIAYIEPVSLFALFEKEPWSLFLDSAKFLPELGRYSYIAFDPFYTISCKDSKIKINSESVIGNPFTLLQAYLAKYQAPSVPDLPPFQGGIAGFFAYDLCHYLENLPSPQIDDMQFPDLMVGFYDVVISVDHVLKKAWVVSTGFPELDYIARRQMAVTRAENIINKINHFLNCSIVLGTSCNDGGWLNAQAIQSNYSRDAYLAIVQRAIDYIYAGDVFEVNLSQRFKALLPEHFNAFALYQQLRQTNPAPFAAYLHFENIIIASASPERFIKLTDKEVETRPIKGTIARGKSKNEDKENAAKLAASEKDRAENIMIVDLLRNDLSKVCISNSIQVPQLCGLETYATVHHLVSVVTGKLQPQYNAIDLLSAAFPGGSITGAPKIRAMEIIAELEPTARGPYCGSIGFIGFNGMMDTSIVIRTFAIKDREIVFQAGGAVVSDSEPAEEYEETLIKARALHEALTK